TESRRPDSGQRLHLPGIRNSVSGLLSRYAIEVLQARDEEAAVRDRGRAVVRIPQVVGGQDFELRPRLDDVALPAAGEIDPAVAVHDRAGPRRSDLVEPLLVGFLAVGRRPDADDASGDQPHDVAGDDDRRADRFAEAADGPLHVGTADVAFPGRIDGNAVAATAGIGVDNIAAVRRGGGVPLPLAPPQPT